MKLLATVLLLGSFAGAQCPAMIPGPGTTCSGPVLITDKPPTVQSSVILVDIGLPNPKPTKGQYIVSIVNGTIQESDDAQPYRTLTGPKGDKGDKGDVGATGAVGVQGATGAVGAQGPVGATGVPGATGATGSQGIQGAQGVQGPTGPQGSTGASGAVGARGLQGVPGVIVGNTITATEVCNLVIGVRTCKLKVLGIQ